jgi:hypothetical protein
MKSVKREEFVNFYNSYDQLKSIHTAQLKEIACMPAAYQTDGGEMCAATTAVQSAATRVYVQRPLLMSHSFTVRSPPPVTTTPLLMSMHHTRSEWP